MPDVYKKINGKFFLVKREDIYNPDAEFDGTAYVSSLDKERLTGLTKDVLSIVEDGKARTLSELCEELLSGDREHVSESSVSATLRNLRKDRFGGFDIRKRRRGDPSQGLFEYYLKLIEE